jgi:predicted YcjX-like family ATPase
MKVFQPLRPRFRRIGITGSSLAGKTVFLLSLLNHLESGDLDVSTDRSKPGPIQRFKKLLLGRDKRKIEFPYDEFRKHLAAGHWPRRTTDQWFYRCRFRRPNHGIIEWDEVEFFDFPGERLADVLMFDADYATWSDRVWNLLKSDPKKRDPAQEFLMLAESPEPKLEGLIVAYKRALAALILDCQPLVSPSTFLLNERGVRARGETIDEIVVGRVAGLDEAEFAPLPASARASFPALGSEFAKRYCGYRKAVVEPFQRHLLECHQLVYLVDVADVLASGPMKLNDTKRMIGELFRCLEPTRDIMPRFGRGFFNFVASAVGKHWSCIERIAFVASQADRVHRDDRGRLSDLLKQLVGNHAKNNGFDDVGFFYCSAARSTQSVVSERFLKGRPTHEFRDGKPQSLPFAGDPLELKVPELPERWPTQWSAETYAGFTHFHPEVPAVHDQPPDQIGLDEIMRFLLK